jgi:hypothetical protein
MTNVLLDVYCVGIHPAEETGVKQSKENETKSERWTSRRRLTDLLFRSERDHSDVSSLDMPLPGGSDRDDLDYFDDDMEMEMEVEMSVGEHGERDRGDWGWSGSVRLRSWGETGEQESVRGGSSGMSTDEISDIQVNSSAVGSQTSFLLVSQQQHFSLFCLLASILQ